LGNFVGNDISGVLPAGPGRTQFYVFSPAQADTGLNRYEQQLQNRMTQSPSPFTGNERRTANGERPEKSAA